MVHWSSAMNIQILILFFSIYWYFIIIFAPKLRIPALFFVCRHPCSTAYVHHCEDEAATDVADDKFVRRRSKTASHWPSSYDVSTPCPNRKPDARASFDVRHRSIVPRRRLDAPRRSWSRNPRAFPGVAALPTCSPKAGYFTHWLKAQWSVHKVRLISYKQRVIVVAGIAIF